MAGNNIVISVKAETAQAEKSFKTLKERVAVMGKETGGLTQKFGGLSKSLLGFGLGTIGAALSIQKLIAAMSTTAKAGANLEFTVARLPTVMKARFNELSPLVDGLAEQFGVTSRQAQAAMATILSVSRNPTVGLEELAGALGFVARGEMSVQAAANLVGRALAGDIPAIRQITQDWGGLNEALAESARTGPLAVTEIDKVGKTFQEVLEDVGAAINSLLEGDFAKLAASFQGILDDFKELPALILNALPGGATLRLALELTNIPEWLTRLKGWVAPNFSLKPLIHFVVDTIPTWMARVWDWTQVFLQPLIHFVVDTIPVWMQRVWDWGKGSIKTFLEFIPVIPNWIMRIWDWSKGSIKTFLHFIPIIPNWIERIWGWAKSGLRIGLDFFLKGFPRIPFPNIPNPFGGSSPSTPTAPIPVSLPTVARQITTAGGFTFGTNLTSAQLAGQGIAALAHGGIARRPTLAMVGEGGPEAIVPLGPGGGFGSVTINIQGDAIIDDELRMGKLVGEIRRLLSQEARRGLSI